MTQGPPKVPPRVPATVVGSVDHHDMSAHMHQKAPFRVRPKSGGRLAPLLIRLPLCQSLLAPPRALALLVQRSSRIATNTILNLPRVARGDRVEQRKGWCRRPHRGDEPSRVEKRGLQKQLVEVGLMTGFPFDRSLALLVQRSSRIATNTILILPRVARGDRVEQRKGWGRRPHRGSEPSRVEKRREGNGRHCRRRVPAKECPVQNTPKDVGFKSIGAIKHTRNPGVWRRVDQGFHQNLRLRSASDWALGRAGRSAEAPRRRIARRGGTYLEGVFDGGTETPDVIASFEGDAKAVGGDPRGAAVLRVLRGAEALQGFPTLLHFALPLLFAEGIRLVLLCAEALQDFPAFLQFAPPLRNLLFAEVKRVAGVRRVRWGWGGRTHSSPRAGCGSRSGAATPRHSNSCSNKEESREDVAC